MTTTVNQHSVILPSGGMMLCKCGCGAVTTIGRDFRHGHWAKANPSFGRKMSAKAKAALAAHAAKVKAGLAPPNALGAKRSEETRRRMSEAAKCRAPVSEDTRRKMSEAHIGKPVHSPEFKARVAQRNRDRVWTPEMREAVRQANLEPTRLQATKLRRATQVLPVRTSKLELEVRQALSELGIPFRANCYVKGIRHQWDIILDERLTLIEVDGCRFHACPKHPTCWRNMVDLAQANATRDRELDAAAVALGWRVIRIWEHDIKGLDLGSVL